jgi:pimeloyl-ACP methyl ester carboxylesterase
MYLKATLAILLSILAESLLANAAQAKWTSFVWSLWLPIGFVLARAQGSTLGSILLAASASSSYSYYKLGDITTAYLAGVLSVICLGTLLRRSNTPASTPNGSMARWRILYLILVLCSTYQAIGLLHDSIRFPAPGELIHANNATHHLHCRGPSNSKHIAVAFAGVPWSSIAFRDSLVNPPITVCAHDRLGYGWSSHPTDQSRDALTQVKEIRQVLLKKNFTEPITLIGWSYGGSIALLYHSLYPEHVKAIVLFESTDDLLMQDKHFVETLELGIFASNIYRMVLPLGFTRLLKDFIPLDFGASVPEMTADTYAMNQAQLLTEKFANAAHYELRSFNQSVHQLIDHIDWNKLKQVPVHVIISKSREKHAHGIDFDRRLEKNGAIVHTSKSDHWGPARGTDDISKVLEELVKSY